MPSGESPNADRYTWIGSTGQSWQISGNWSDVTAGLSPAPYQPGLLTPVTIMGATGITYEVIVGGGVAASLAVSGNVDLVGTYAVEGLLALGAASAVTATPFLLAPDAVVTTGSISLGADSTATISAGATLSAVGSLSLTGGGISDNGGAVAVGTINSSSEVSVTAAGTASVAGDAAFSTGGLEAVGAGSSISVSGTLVSSSAGGGYTEGFHIYNGNAVAVGGASIQLGGAVFDDDTDAGGVLYGLAVDGTSSIEIGSAGGAAPGAITVDAGSTISIDSTASVFFESPVIEDGALLVTRGTLTLESGVSGSGLLQVGTNATLSVQGNVTGSAVVQIGAGATLQLAGNVASTDSIDFNGSSAILSIGVGDVVGATITGFGLGDSIIVGSPVTSADYMAGTGSNPGSLLLMNGTAAVGSLSLSGDFTDDTFFVSPTTTGGGDILLIAACYLEGTRIETEHGLVKIELIEPGDMIRVRGGRLLPAQWLGYRHIDCRRHPRPSQVWPVRVKAGAFGPAQPACDLWLSPDHAVFLDGVLIPIRYLINGATIVQEAAEEVTYWHIELESHEIISADGLMAESFLDTGNRAAFSNGGAMTDLHPDFAFRTWNERAAAPLAVGGAEVEAARSYLLDRAQDLGHQLTTQPRLRLFADDIEIGAVRYVFGNMFLAPREARLLRLSTRSAVPAHVFDDSQDYRRLGVAISHIRLDGQHIDLCDPRLGRGWHQPETSNGWRWTDGDAEIALGTGGLLEIEIARVVRYWLPPVPVGAQTEAA